jgi:hypothetical protein
MPRASALAPQAVSGGEEFILIRISLKYITELGCLGTVSCEDFVADRRTASPKRLGRGGTSFLWQAVIPRS